MKCEELSELVEKLKTVSSDTEKKKLLDEIIKSAKAEQYKIIGNNGNFNLASASKMFAEEYIKALNTYIKDLNFEEMQLLAEKTIGFNGGLNVLLTFKTKKYSLSNHTRSIAKIKIADIFEIAEVTDYSPNRKYLTNAEFETFKKNWEEKKGYYISKKTDKVFPLIDKLKENEHKMVGVYESPYAKRGIIQSQDEARKMNTKSNEGPCYILSDGYVRLKKPKKTKKTQKNKK